LFSREAEWSFLFRRAIDWESILPLQRPEFSGPDAPKLCEELLAATESWAGGSLSKRARELDLAGPGRVEGGGVVLSAPMESTIGEARDLGFFGFSVAPEHGGLGAPFLVPMLSLAQVARGCLATSSQLALYVGIPDMLERFCERDERARLIPRVVRGEIGGSMCLTEPDAGSDVGALRTTARALGDGAYALQGTKRFITNGGGGLGLVLARIEGAPAGLEGVSLFLCEELIDGRRNFEVTRLEEKMGQRGSSVCEVVYDGSRAKLVGEAGGGFRIMLHLMNAARITVGLQSLGGLEAAIGGARAYASGRKQFGRPIAELPLMRRNLEDWETEVDAFRALMFDTLSWFEVFQALDLRERRAARGEGAALAGAEALKLRRARSVARARTPLVKFHGAEACTALSQRAIQAMGGYGMMCEYDLERIHRDSFGNLLYEGTSQIQALMAMKDFVKDASRDPAKFVQALVGSHPLARLGSSRVARAAAEARYELRKNFALLLIRSAAPGGRESESGFLNALSHAARGGLDDPGRLERLMIHAETLCQALADVATLEVLARHARRDEERSELFWRFHRLSAPRLAGIHADWRSG
jgi:alkylation response protein AidB-like acyl-CoA dehydrogenase